MNKIKVITAVIALALGIGIFLSAQNNEANNQTIDYTKIGNKLICPVMGEKFTITEKTPSVEYNGKMYFFCCPGCVEKFKKEPDKYLKGDKSEKKHKKCCDDKEKKHEHKHKEGKMCNDCDSKKESK